MFRVYYKFCAKWYLSDIYNQAANAIMKYDKLKKDFDHVKVTIEDEEGNEHTVMWTNGETTIEETSKISG